MIREIILASGSRQRQTVFASLGIPFKSVTSDIDEKNITASTEKERARAIATAKAEAVRAHYPDSIIISGDTFTFVNGKAYEKPETLVEASTMLKEQSGKQGICYSGFCYLDQKNQMQFSTTVETTFIFRDLNEQEIKRYCNNNPVLEWSGAFNTAYPEGVCLIRAIAGSLSSFTYGLPMEQLIPLLEQSGVLHETA